MGDNFGGTLPPGTYESVQPFANLNGCPLNGVWQLEICDLLGRDNGLCSIGPFNLPTACIP